MAPTTTVEVEAPPVEGGDVSLDAKIDSSLLVSHADACSLPVLRTALGYVASGSTAYDIEQDIAGLSGQLKYNTEPIRDGVVQVKMDPSSSGISSRIMQLLKVKDLVKEVRQMQETDERSADYLSRTIVQKLSKYLPRSEKAERAYELRDLRLCAAIIGGVGKGDWVYFPIDQEQHPQDPFFLQLARVSGETGKPVLELATVYHGNSEDVELCRVTPAGRERIDFKEFRDGPQAVGYLMQMFQYDSNT
jgi:hypothetical protein